MSLNQHCSPNIFLPSVSFRDLTTTSTLKLSDGNQSAPSLCFADDTNTGLYSPANDVLAIGVGGFPRITMDSNWNNFSNFSERSFIPNYSTGITNNQPARNLTWRKINSDVDLMLFCDITNNTGGNITSFNITNIQVPSSGSFACFLPCTNSAGNFCGIARAVINGSTVTVTIEGISVGNTGNLSNTSTFVCGPAVLSYRV